MLSIAPGALERIATALGVKSHPPGEGEFRVVSVVDRGRLSRAFDLLSQTVSHDEDAALTKREAGAIERAFLEIAVRSLAGDSSRSPPYQSARLTSARIVRTCEDYARKWRYQDVTLAGLCEASGVSERRVRSAFYECYQMSPTAYLRVVALNAVRRELVEGPRLRDAVSRAATDWGFWHLSRFAAQYRGAIRRVTQTHPQPSNGSTPSSRKLSSEVGEVLIPLHGHPPGSPGLETEPRSCARV